MRIALEEYEFFTELCQLALSIDRNVRFAGVVDNNGRLLTGKYRKDIKSPLQIHCKKRRDEQLVLRKLQVGGADPDV